MVSLHAWSQSGTVIRRTMPELRKWFSRRLMRIGNDPSFPASLAQDFFLVKWVEREIWEECAGLPLHSEWPLCLCIFPNQFDWFLKTCDSGIEFLYRDSDTLVEDRQFLPGLTQTQRLFATADWSSLFGITRASNAQDLPSTHDD